MSFQIVIKIHKYYSKCRTKLYIEIVQKSGSNVIYLNKVVQCSVPEREKSHPSESPTIKFKKSRSHSTPMAVTGTEVKHSSHNALSN